MMKYTLNAPYGVTAIQLDNGDEALYLHGECLVLADFHLRDDSVIATGERMAEVLGVPFTFLTLPEPENEEWCWNEVVEALGWGKSMKLGRMVMRPVLECCISHITADDNTLLTELCREKFEGEWIMDTGVGYLIRLDARMHPLMHLKRFGLSRDARWLIAWCMKHADISMIHFSQTGDELEPFTTFDW
ncbi:hypothetical protein M979_4340 [Buttiauxella noackiae ATCC 51607]|uniref:DUF5983 domain-containing protein n=3 Tax=Buttiauxella TaxID=82976 RepID=A0A1B7HG95_9ENTR|nr:hypothetical protein M979_4340 [Buttiauxella noackiae ATCC 51607]